jgi:soluble lytic murein transglycosylase-like protein
MRKAWLGLVVVALATVSGKGVARADIYVYRDAAGAQHFTMWGGDARHFRPYAARGRGVRGHDPGRYGRFDAFIAEAVGVYQVPEALVRAVIRCESDYDPTAISPAGALGLMQLMPGTAQRLGVRDPLDPRQNILAGVRLLRELADEFKGDLTLTVAAYNAGDAAVLRFGGVPPYRETREYVAAVARYFRRYRDAQTRAGRT